MIIRAQPQCDIRRFCSGSGGGLRKYSNGQVGPKVPRAVHRAEVAAVQRHGRARGEKVREDLALPRLHAGHVLDQPDDAAGALLLDLPLQLGEDVDDGEDEPALLAEHARVAAARAGRLVGRGEVLAWRTRHQQPQVLDHVCVARNLPPWGIANAKSKNKTRE